MSQNEDTPPPDPGASALPGAAILREWRTSAKQTQTDVAFGCGSSASRISDLERGVAIPSIEMAVRLENLSGGAVPVRAWVRPEFASPPA